MSRDAVRQGSWKERAHLVGLVVATSLLLSGGPAVRAAESEGGELDVAVTFAPDVVELEPGEQGWTILTVTNGGVVPVELGSLQLSGVAAVSLEEVGASLAGPASPGTTRSALVRVTRSAQGLLPTVLPVRVPVEATDGEWSQLPAVLTVTPRTGAGIVDVLEVTLDGSGGAVDEFLDQRVLVTVTNTGQRPVVIEDVTTVDPPLLDVVLEDWFTPGGASARDTVTVEPRGATVASFVLSVADDAQQRSASVPIPFLVTASVEGQPATRTTLVALHTVPLEVFGQSELTQFLKIPSLLFLPGFLLLSAFVVAARVRPLRTRDVTAMVDVYGAAVVVVIGSLVLGALYSFVTNRDVRVGYDFDDVLNLALLGLVVGAAAYVVIAVSEALHVRRRQPMPGDEPVDVLRKLRRQKLSLERPRAAAVGEDMDWGLAHLYDAGETPAGRRAIGPPIVWRLVESQDDRDRNDDAVEVERCVREALDANDVGALLDAVAEHPDHVELAWRQADTSLTGIRLVSASDVSTREPARAVTDA